MAVVWPIPLEKGWAHRLQGRNSSWLSMVQPTWALKLVPRGSQRPPASPHSRTDLCGTQLSLGKPVCPPPLPTPLQGISSHLPPIAANTVIQRVISKETKKKKKIPGVRGNFSHKASGSRGALTAPRTQLGAPSIVNTVLRGRDINRTYVQRRGEGDECFPKVEIKVINNILLSLFSHKALAAKGNKKKEQSKS